jgi:hypothetical protein
VAAALVLLELELLVLAEHLAMTPYLALLPAREAAAAVHLAIQPPMKLD